MAGQSKAEAKRYIVFDDKKFFISNGYYHYNGYGRARLNRKYLHVYVWEKHHGKKVPDDHIIHHIDNNKQNNSIENLQCMTVSEHKSHHAKEAWKLRNKKMITCRQCKASVKTRTLSSYSGFCSRYCYIKLHKT